MRKIVSKEREPNGFKEPRRWHNSTVFRLLERDIRDGVVHSAPTNPSDWETIYIMRPEYSLFDNKKFEKGLRHFETKQGNLLVGRRRTKVASKRFWRATKSPFLVTMDMSSGRAPMHNSF